MAIESSGVSAQSNMFKKILIASRADKTLCSGPLRRRLARATCHSDPSRATYV